MKVKGADNFEGYAWSQQELLFGKPDVKAAGIAYVQTIDGDRITEVYNSATKQWLPVNIGDFIFKGLNDEFFPCSEFDFHNKFDVVGL